MSESGRAPHEEVILPLHVPRYQLQPTTQFRTTWIVSSQNTLRARGLYDRYLALVPDEHRDTMAMTIVGGWMPIELAMVHYRACDALELSNAEKLEIGRAVTKHLNQTLLSTVVRLATTSGATVWTPLSQLRRLWDRMFVGGGVAVYKLGPKEARIEVLACTLAQVQYFRAGLQGVLLGLGELFTRKLYIHELPRQSSPTTVVLRASWV